MSRNSRALGKGLDALFVSSAPSVEQEYKKAAEEQENIFEIEIAKIVPNKFQPRRVFDDEALGELAQSIKQYGVLQPIVVRRVIDGYELVAGERRWRASRMAGLKVIPAVIKEYSDGEMTEVALIENLQRQDLNPIEEAMAYKRLMEEFGLTQEEVSRKVGRSRSLIANTVRLLNLHETVREYVSRGTLTMGQAKPLLSLTDTNLQLQAAEMVVAEDLSARDVEQLVKNLSSKARQKKPAKSVRAEDIHLREVENTLKLLLGTQVKIKPGKIKGKIEIEYYSSEDLERIVEVLSPEQQAACTKTKAQFVV